MLTLTYALVALSVEHKRVNSALVAVQQEIRHAQNTVADVEVPMLETLVSRLNNLDTACRERNLELFVIPALRNANEEVDRILGDLEALSSMGRILLKNVKAKLREARTSGSVDAAEIFKALDTYCKHMLTRTKTEEQQLLPLSQRLISGDEWFDIAAQFISHETERQGRKSFSQSIIEGISSLPASAPSSSQSVYQVTS